MVQESRHQGESKGFCSTDDITPCDTDVGHPFDVFVCCYAANPSSRDGSASVFPRKLADMIYHEFEPSVSEAYLILPAFKPILKNAADIALIVTVYRIIKIRNRWITGDEKAIQGGSDSTTSSSSILTPVGIADAAIYIYAEVVCFTQTELIKTSNGHLSSKMVTVAACY
jgi:hypothetical protein